MYNALLVLHIIAVTIWLGANVVLGFVGPRVATADVATRVWWAETQGAMARVLYNVAGIVVLVTGVGMVLDSNISFASVFVSVGFLAVFVGAVLGMAVFGPGSRKLSAAISEGDSDTERAVTARLTAFGLVDSIVVVVAIVAMVGKWGISFS